MMFICLCVYIVKYIDFDRRIEYKRFIKYMEKRKFLLLFKILEYFRIKDVSFWIIVFRGVQECVYRGGGSVEMYDFMTLCGFVFLGYIGFEQ